MKKLHTIIPAVFLACTLGACGIHLSPAAPDLDPTIAVLKTDVAQLKTRTASKTNPQQQTSPQPSPTSPLTDEIVSTEGLMLYFNFENSEPQTVIDLSGNHFTGQARGTSYDPAGSRGSALYFNGINDSILVPASPGLNLNSAVTLSVFFKVEDYLSQQPLLEWNNGIQPGTSLWANAVGFGWQEDRTGIDLVSAIGDEASHIVNIPNPIINEWHQLAATYDAANGSTQIYLDGALVRQENLARFEPQTSYDLYLGSHIAQQPSHFKGWMDEVRIYRRILTAKEILDLYHFGRMSIDK